VVFIVLKQETSMTLDKIYHSFDLEITVEMQLHGLHQELGKKDKFLQELGKQ